jgi:hypothetical protein
MQYVFCLRLYVRSSYIITAVPLMNVPVRLYEEANNFTSVQILSTLYLLRTT